MARTRHALTLDMIGIPLGATLTFVGKPEEKCIVANLNPPKLVYKDSVYWMTPLVKLVLEVPDQYAPQPAQNLVYKGETLAERRERFEKYHTYHLG